MGLCPVARRNSAQVRDGHRVVISIINDQQINGSSSSSSRRSIITI